MFFKKSVIVGFGTLAGVTGGAYMYFKMENNASLDNLPQPDFIRAKDPKVDHAVRVSEAIMRANQFAILSNIDDKGSPGSGVIQSRAVQPQPPPPGIHHVHLVTTSLSRKHGQLKHNPKATLTYLDASGIGYVTIIGECAFVDQQEALNHYLPEYAVFFPKGVETGGYTIIRFTPEILEVSSQRYQLFSKRDDWLPHRLVRLEGSWDLAEASAPL